MLENKNLNSRSNADFIGDLNQRNIRNSANHEIKSRRLQLLMKPSLHKRIKETADNNGLSVNELIHSVLESYLIKENIQ